MISKKMTAAINDQINKEYYSAFLYQSMAAWCLAEGLNGFANWFDVQFQEESAHARKFYDYVNQQGERVLFKTIDAPETEFESVIDLFKKTLDHERTVTASINNLVTLAKSENDHATDIFLQWFITEQVEEEASANEILQKLKIGGSKGSALFMMDAELGARVFTPPPAA